MDIEVVVDKFDGIGFLIHDCRSLKALNKSVCFTCYYSRQEILTTVYHFRNRHLTGMEYHYTEDGMFDGIINHRRRYVLSREDDSKMRLHMNC